MENSVALVPAAGSGTRLGLGPKAFLQIRGESLIHIIVGTLSGLVDRILVGVPTAYLNRARAEIGNLAEVYPGGASRQDTVLSLFERCSEHIVVIHDGAHPFASRDLITGVINAARKDGAAMAFIQPHKPIARYEQGFVIESTPSAEVGLHQSPQAYHRRILDRAFKYAVENGIETQATWELVVRLGIPVRAVPGEETNIKITTPFDWEIATKVIAPSFDSR